MILYILQLLYIQLHELTETTLYNNVVKIE